MGLPKGIHEREVEREREKKNEVLYQIQKLAGRSLV